MERKIQMKIHKTVKYFTLQNVLKICQLILNNQTNNELMKMKHSIKFKSLGMNIYNNKVMI